MFEKLNFEDFRNLSLAHKRVAVYQEFSSDMLTPMSGLQALQEKEKEVILLESGETESSVGRYSHIGFAPIAQIEAYGSDIKIKEGKETSSHEGDPFQLLRKLRLKYSCGSNRRLLGFSGGAAGYLSYDGVRFFEDIPDSNAETLEFPDLFFQFFDRGVSFDHKTNQVLIVRIIGVNGDAKSAYNSAMEEIQDIYNRVASIHPKKNREVASFDLEKDVTITPSDEAFKMIIQKAKG